jgi:hypothetical protein
MEAIAEDKSVLSGLTPEKFNQLKKILVELIKSTYSEGDPEKELNKAFLTAQISSYYGWPMP